MSGTMLAQRCCVPSPTELEAKLAEADRQVLRRKGNETGIGEHLDELSRSDVSP